MSTSKPASGILIAFEGIDGSGKSTQLTLLADRIRQTGRPVTVAAEPTKGPHGQALRDAWLAGHRLPVEEELALFEADRRDHVEQVIQPALDRGHVVLIDRYYYSSAAYQGSQPGQSPDAILDRFESFCPRPDLVLLFDLPVDEALRRMQVAREVLDAMEARDNLERVRDAFFALGREEIVSVQAVGEVDDVAERIWQVVEGVLIKIN